MHVFKAAISQHWPAALGELDYLYFNPSWLLRLDGGPPPRWSCCMLAVGICPASPPPETSRPLCCPSPRAWKGRRSCGVRQLVMPRTASEPFLRLRCLPGQLACKFRGNIFQRRAGISKRNRESSLYGVWERRTFRKRK